MWSRDDCCIEARSVCRSLRCKYIQVSAALNHHVDDLLVGLVQQIRLNPDRMQVPVTSAPQPTRCFSALTDFLARLVGKQSTSSFDCNDLWTL